MKTKFKGRPWYWEIPYGRALLSMTEPKSIPRRWYEIKSMILRFFTFCPGCGLWVDSPFRRSVGKYTQLCSGMINDETLCYRCYDRLK